MSEFLQKVLRIATLKVLVITNLTIFQIVRWRSIYIETITWKYCLTLVIWMIETSKNSFQKMNTFTWHKKTLLNCRFIRSQLLPTTPNTFPSIYINQSLLVIFNICGTQYFCSFNYSFRSVILAIQCFERKMLDQKYLPLSQKFVWLGYFSLTE